MINTILFSKDNPARLFTALMSLKTHFKEATIINVIYDFSNTDFQKGYEKLISEEKNENITFVRQSDLKNNLLHAVQKNSGLTCFLTDEEVFFNSPVVSEIEKIMNDQEVFCFSLRLGKNTTNCFSANAKNNLYGEEIDGLTMKWNWQKHYLDFGNSILLTGHIYRTKEVIRFIKQVNFKTYMELEEALQIFESFPKEKMASFTDSVVISIPTFVEVKVGAGEDQKSIKEDNVTLNQKFLNNIKIDLGKMNFKNIEACERYTQFRFNNE